MSHSVRVPTSGPALVPREPRATVLRLRAPAQLLALCLIAGSFAWVALELYRLNELAGQQSTAIDSHWRYEAHARELADLAQHVGTKADATATQLSQHRAALANEYRQVLRTHQHLLSAMPGERTAALPFGAPYLRAYRLHGAELDRSILGLAPIIDQLLLHPAGEVSVGETDAAAHASAVSDTVLGTILPTTQDVLSHYLLEMEERRTAAQRTVKLMLALAMLGVLGATLYVYGPMAHALSTCGEELRRARTALLHDELTGLANRRYLKEFASVALAGTRRTQRPGALLRLDVDYFKRINDTLGHAGGDIALRKVADLLRTEVRQSDLAVRMGGDEFVVLACELGEGNGYHTLADRLLARFRNPIMIDGRLTYISVSIGISLTPTHSSNLEELLSQSDLALYEAKHRGRNQWQLYVPGGGTGERTSPMPPARARP